MKLNHSAHTGELLNKWHWKMLFFTGITSYFIWWGNRLDRGFSNLLGPRLGPPIHLDVWLDQNGSPPDTTGGRSGPPQTSEGLCKLLEVAGKSLPDLWKWLPVASRGLQGPGTQEGGGWRCLLPQNIWVIENPWTRGWNGQARLN